MKIHRKKFKGQSHVSCFTINAKGQYRFRKCPGAKKRRGKK